jgi:hypothetical protein
MAASATSAFAAVKPDIDIKEIRAMTIKRVPLRIMSFGAILNTSQTDRQYFIGLRKGCNPASTLNQLPN